MDLSWTAPVSDGGCPITSYSIWVENQLTSIFEQVDVAQVNNIPELREHTLTFSSADTSKTFRMYLQAENVIGSVQSDTVAYKLAAPPSKPTDPPRLDLAQTRSYQIQADYDALSALESGGSDIISYELQIYNDTTSLWQSVTGGEGDFSLTNTFTYWQGIKKGKSY